jgi:hypothetical protein
MRRGTRVSLWVAVALLWVGAGSAIAATPTLSLSEKGLLQRLVSPAAQLEAMPAGVSVSQLSSHDLAGGNVDGGSYTPAMASALPLTYVSRAGSSYVLADENGPGCLVRMWMTADSDGTDGDVASFGNIQLYFDGSSTPAVNEPATQFFSGEDPRFPVPLVNDYLNLSGGDYSYVPFCFAHSLQVRVTGSLTLDGNYFQLTFLNARTGTPVQTFKGGEPAAQSAAKELAGAGKAPTAKPSATTSATIGPGGAVALRPLSGPGTVRYLRFTVKPFDISTLDGLSLQVNVDGASHPQVDVPLADVFGDGLETRSIQSLDFGEDPATDTGYLALPIPYAKLARVSLRSETANATVSFSGWKGPSTHTNERLYGQQLVTQTKLGQDFPVLDAGGSGHLASYVMDVSDPGTPGSGVSGGQWFMEGDERVSVDGLRSPSIYGTGTEDEFDGGYYFAKGAFTLPFNGAGPLGQTAVTDGGTQSAYRVFVDDGVTWSDGVQYTQQAGGDNERLPETAVATTFSYRAPQSLFPSDSVDFDSTQSEQAHHLTGGFTPVQLDAYFEGVHDGTIPVSTVVFGGTDYFSPPPQLSDQSVAADGIAFQSPVSVTLGIPKANDGVVLRRLQDQATPAPVEVLVDGHAIGTWAGAAFQGNPVRRWLESDFEIPPKLTSGRRTVVVTLEPSSTGETATAYSLEALTRTAG